MRRLALLVAHLHRFDAVANDTRGIQRLFESRGICARIFAPSGDPGVPYDPINKIKEFITDPSDGVLLAYAGHWPLGESLFSSLPGTKILRYHNVTPPEFYAKWDAESARLCAAGRRGLSPLIEGSRPDLFLPDSKFNARDLIEAGADPERMHVVPVFHQIDELLASTKPTLTSKERLSGRIEPGQLIESLFSPKSTVILMVGRLVPSKGWHHFLEAAHLFVKHYNKDSVFVMAGTSSPRLGKYYRKLEAQISSLGLEGGLGGRILRLESLGASELAALYKRADAFLICSEHEGFCVPLVESMAFGLPIVALKRGAIPETLGDAGIAWEESDAALMAASLQRLLSDASLCSELRTRGQRRYHSHFRNDVVAQKFCSLFSFR